MTAPARSAERLKPVSAWRPAILRSAPLRIAVVPIGILWSTPPLGLLVTSVRHPAEITTSARTPAASASSAAGIGGRARTAGTPVKACMSTRAGR